LGPKIKHRTHNTLVLGHPGGSETNKNRTQHSRASATRLRSLSTEPFKDFFMELRVERTSTTIAGADL
jgi:hypothetical protein